MVRQEILRAGYHNLLPAGIVLSGGGSQLLGCAELCQEVTGMPTRVGSPRDVEGISNDLRSPVYATAIGLVQYGALHYHQSRLSAHENSMMGRIQRFFARIMSRAVSG